MCSLDANENRDAQVFQDSAELTIPSSELHHLLQKFNSTEPTFTLLGPLDNWKQMITSIGPVFIYSAYYDQRFKNTQYVRIFAVAPMRTALKKTVRCVVQDTRGDSHQAIVPSTVRVLPENWGLPFAAHRFDCELPKDMKPEMVTLMETPREGKTITDLSVISPVVVQYPHLDPFLGDFALCVKPFHYAYDRAVWLVEFIEFYRIMGVQHFLFYNHTVGTNVQRVLEHYQKSNLLTVLPWDLPLRSQKDIRTEGIFAALNDCIFRTSHRFRYTVVVDLDEFIVPRNHNNYSSLMAFLDKPPYRHGSFVFRNAFFYMYWSNDTKASDFFQDKELPQVPYLLTLFKTQRLRLLHKIGVRSKYIVRPNLVIEAGNHMIWKFAAGKVHLSVSGTIALSHHYRICEYGGYECLKMASEVDRTAQKFATQLVPNVFKECRDIFPEHPECPEAPPLGSPW